MIRLKNVSKTYAEKNLPGFALKNANLDISQGEAVAVMGRSGSGKTSLLKILGCLEPIDSGEYFLQGEAVHGMSDSRLAEKRNRDIGFVLQDFALVNHWDVLYNVCLPLFFDGIKGKSGKDRKAMGMEVLSKVGMEGFAAKKVNRLSGGEKQRVAIARALVKAPPLILADEPTGALDGTTGREIMELLQKLNKNGTTLIVVTHDEMVAAYCKRLLTLEDGIIYPSERTD